MNAKNTLSGKALDSLASSLSGDVLRPGTGDYDSARSIWNGMIDRHPAVIARCRHVEDVVRAVGFARDNALPLAVRSGGHNIAGNALCEDGLVIDLSMMNTVAIDPGKRRASVGPGALLADFDREAQTAGLATPLGINSTTGVAGLTLGGGFGWLTRKHGMTVDNLVAADVVTAGGRTLAASADENPDLFWALRGGGGNFGIVTRFEYRLHPVGPEVLAGLIVYPHADARGILERYREFAAAAPDELSAWVIMRKAPPLPFLPESVHGESVLVIAFCYAGDVREGGRYAEALQSFAEPHGVHAGAMPYTDWQQVFDPLLGPGARNYWKSHNFTELEDGVLEKMIKYAERLPTPECEIFLAQLGGAANRVDKQATAYPHRDVEFVLNVHTRWSESGDDERCIAWAREFFEATERHAQGGAYVNFMTADEMERVKAAYGVTYDRLAGIKARHDPDNIFRLNQNILPAA